MVVTRESENPELLGTLTLPGVDRSVAYSRHFLRDLLPADHPVVYDLTTVVSELVCNAIAHTASGRDGQVTIRLLRWDGRLRLVVVDDGADGRRPQERQENGDEDGRGIRIVKALACRWGFTEDGPRTVVWAEFKESVLP
jgi:anti-sigma regulatory factor (Ser/Thr protein kinase)